MPIELAALLAFTAGLMAAQALHLYCRARTEQSLLRAERDLDQPCPRCGIERWRATQAFVIPGTGIQSRCICGHHWEDILVSERQRLPDSSVWTKG